MEIKVEGVLLRGADNAVVLDANNLIREEAMGYSPRSLGEACGLVAGKIEHWQSGRLVLLPDELKKVAYALEVKFKVLY